MIESSKINIIEDWREFQEQHTYYEGSREEMFELFKLEQQMKAAADIERILIVIAKEQR